MIGLGNPVINKPINADYSEKPMLKLITFPAAFDEPSASPFCVKAMCLLKASGVDWIPKFTSDPRKAPNGKLPILIDGENTIADSEAIRANLEDTYACDFDKGLTPEQRATSRAVIRMVEEHLYFVMVGNRWLNDDNWPLVKQAFFGEMPKPLGGLVAHIARKKTRAQVVAQGTGRHSVQVQTERARQDIEAIKAMLGDKPYLFGDTPTAADMSVVPIIRGISTSPTQTGLRDLVTNDPTLMTYLERGRDTLYPT